MRKSIVFVIFTFTVMLLVGCSSTSKSIAVATTDNTDNNSGGVVIDGETVEVNSGKIEVDPTATQVKLVMYDDVFSFEDEAIWLYRLKSSWEEKFGARVGKSLQSVVAERYPKYAVVKVERTRENLHSWGIFTVYYISLKEQ